MGLKPDTGFELKLKSASRGKTVIERMLANPKRFLLVRKELHIGQTVRFMVWRDGQMRIVTVVAMQDTQVTI